MGRLLWWLRGQGSLHQDDGEWLPLSRRLIEQLSMDQASRFLGLGLGEGGMRY
jgi:hypothetical protein